MVAPSCEEANNDNGTKTITLEGFRQDTVDESAQRQRFTVTREDGMEELKKDILGYYKNPRINLKAKLRVKFEGGGRCGQWACSRIFALCNKNC